MKTLKSSAFRALENFVFKMYKLTGWAPDEDDERQLMRNIKIRIAMDDANSRKTTKISLNSLQDELNIR